MVYNRIISNSTLPPCLTKKLVSAKLFVMYRFRKSLTVEMGLLNQDKRYIIRLLLSYTEHGTCCLLQMPPRDRRQF